MSRHRQEPRIYNNETLMHDFNILQIRIKVHLFNIGDDNLKRYNPKPSVEELDQMMNRVMQVLREDSKPMRQF